MKTPVFTGSAVAIVTPFRDGKVDFNKLGKLVDTQIEQGTQAIVVCGTTGEASTLNDGEHLGTVGYVVKRAAGRVPVIAGTGSNDTEHALYLSQEACHLGADALLVVTPYYNKTTQHGLVKHYYYIADRVDKPIILYHIPARCVMGYTLDTYKELAKHERIVGVKEASGDFKMIAQIRAHLGDDMLVWSGNDNETLPIMALGGLGVISVATNIIPAEMQAICKLWLDGKVKESEERFLKAIPLLDALGYEVNPIPVKAAMNLLGMDVGVCRMPLCDMLPKNLEMLKTVMKDYGLAV
ncbi:MAG: 4-hydroxy-tetrahydrodipicolinate synthase [Oscillospiraceae bacterium]|jgi:4-hydroxy-tetrahydrodipicolinate synthase|nr:4-hydroxy-tetrahydrodipicolinate synthase [Oscillospiraceae bacterium]